MMCSDLYYIYPTSIPDYANKFTHTHGKTQNKNVEIDA